MHFSARLCARECVWRVAKEKGGGEGFSDVNFHQTHSSSARSLVSALERENCNFLSVYDLWLTQLLARFCCALIHALLRYYYKPTLASESLLVQIKDIWTQQGISTKVINYKSWFLFFLPQAVTWSLLKTWFGCDIFQFSPGWQQMFVWVPTVSVGNSVKSNI